MGINAEMICARVSIETKSAVEAYADNNAITIAAAVERLISDGLKYREQDNVFLNIMSSALNELTKGGD